MAKDPVCGMQASEKKAAAKTAYAGKTYCFCSSVCKTRFDKNPERYLAGTGRPMSR